MKKIISSNLEVEYHYKGYVIQLVSYGDKYYNIWKNGTKVNDNKDLDTLSKVKRFIDMQ